MARADHDELACLTLEVQQQEKALAELGPELGKLEEQTQQSALTEQQLLAEKIAAEREWGALQPELKRAQGSTPAFGKAAATAEKSSRRGRRSGVQLTLEQGWRQQRQQVEQPRPSTCSGAPGEEHKELAPVARQWQPLLTAMQDWAEDADRLQQLLTLREHKLRALRQLQHQLSWGSRSATTGCASRAAAAAARAAGQQWRASGQGAGAVAGQTEQLGQLRQLLELADYGRNHGEQHGRLQQEIAQLEQALGKLAILGDELTPARERLALQRDEARHALEQSRAIASFEQHRHILRDGEPARSAAPRTLSPEPATGGGHSGATGGARPQPGARVGRLNHQYIQCERAPGAARQLAVRQQHLPELETRAEQLTQRWQQLGGAELLGHPLPLRQSPSEWNELMSTLLGRGQSLEQGLARSQQQLREAQLGQQQLQAVRQQLSWPASTSSSSSSGRRPTASASPWKGR